MGTAVTLLGPAGAEVDALNTAARRVEARFEELEQRFSRFRPSSELSRVNRSAGAPTRVSEGYAEVVRFALDGAERTGGLFDPTVLPALVAAGYDRDFDELTAHGPRSPQTVAAQISIEAAQPRLDLAVLKSLPGKQIMVGVLDLGTEAIETAEQVAERIRAALAHVPAERLIIAPDCGMKYLPRAVAYGKLAAMCAGAAVVRRELAGR